MKGIPEEECFWILVYVIEELMPREYYTNMLALRADIQLVYRILEARDPELLEHFKFLHVDLSLFTVESFLTIYTNTCHTDITDVVIDHFLLSGAVTLIKAIVLMLTYLREKILDQKSFGSLGLTRARSSFI